MIADVVKTWRRMNGLSLREASEKIGIDRNALYRLEDGKPVNMRSFAKVLRWLFPCD